MKKSVFLDRCLILCLYSLVDDSLVLKLELMMKRQDLMDFEVVFALYTISHCADMMFDEIADCDLPEPLISGYRSVRSSISSLVKSIEQYRDEKMGTFMSACED